MATIRKNIDAIDSRKFDLYNFIANYLNDYKDELVEKLGFNYNKFKKSGNDLFLSSIEMDLNYPVKCCNELIVDIHFLDILGSKFRVASKMRNTSGGLVATAVSTFAVGTSGISLNNTKLHDYFETEEVEDIVFY